MRSSRRYGGLEAKVVGGAARPNRCNRGVSAGPRRSLSVVGMDVGCVYVAGVGIVSIGTASSGAARLAEGAGIGICIGARRGPAGAGTVGGVCASATVVVVQIAARKNRARIARAFARRPERSARTARRQLHEARRKNGNIVTAHHSTRIG